MCYSFEWEHYFCELGAQLEGYFGQLLPVGYMECTSNQVNQAEPVVPVPMCFWMCSSVWNSMTSKTAISCNTMSVLNTSKSFIWWSVASLHKLQRPGMSILSSKSRRSFPQHGVSGCSSCCATPFHHSSFHMAVHCNGILHPSGYIKLGSVYAIAR